MADGNRAIIVSNAIRGNASDMFQDRVPEATAENIRQFSKPILEFSPLQNEFISGLVQRICVSVTMSKIYQNPLAQFKKGAIPLGTVAQEIFTNPAKDEGFSGNGITTVGGVQKTALNITYPDTKALYYSRNRESQYPVSVSSQQLRSAFVSWEALDDLIASIVNSMYSGDNIDEFTLMKQLFVDAVSNNMLVTQTVADPTASDANAKAFIKAVNTVSGKMRFPSANYNRYIEQEGATGDPIITWTERDQQVIIMRSDVLASVELDVLAFAFNMSKADFRARVVEVDEFNGNENILAVVCDSALIRVYDNLTEMSEQYNAKGLFWNYFWNHWETLALTLFANACVFISESESLFSIDIDSESSADATITVPTSATAGTTVNGKIEWAEATSGDLFLGETELEVALDGTFSFTMPEADATLKAVAD